MSRASCGILLGAALLAVACAPAEPAIVRIGLVGNFTGTMRGSSGVPAREGAELAVDELNAAGGVLIDGRKHQLRLVDLEVENRPDAAAMAARRLINLDSIDVLIGPQTSSMAIAAAPVAEESEVLMIAPMASNPLVTAGRRFVFRLAFLDSFQGEVLARFAYDSLGVRRAGALHDAASEYGRDITALFRKTFTELGGTVVGVETYDTDGPHDFRPQLRRLLARDPQALLLPNFVTPDSTQLTQARAIGFRGRFLGSDSWDVRGLAPNPSAQRSLVVANWDRGETRPRAAHFYALWRAKHSHVPTATTAATYDAIHLAVLAMQRAKARGGIAVADSLRHFGEYEGAVTKYDFRGSNDPYRGATLLELSPSGLTVRGNVPPRPR